MGILSRLKGRQKKSKNTTRTLQPVKRGFIDASGAKGKNILKLQRERMGRLREVNIQLQKGISKEAMTSIAREGKVLGLNPKEINKLVRQTVKRTKEGEEASKAHSRILANLLKEKETKMK